MRYTTLRFVQAQISIIIMGGILSKATEGAFGLRPGGTASAVISVAYQFFNTNKKAKANKENQENLDTQVTEIEADYNNSTNKSFLETNVAKDKVKRQDETLSDNRKV